MEFQQILNVKENFIASAKTFYELGSDSEEFVKFKQELALHRFHPDTILTDWDEKVFNG